MTSPKRAIDVSIFPSRPASRPRLGLAPFASGSCAVAPAPFGADYYGVIHFTNPRYEPPWKERLCPDLWQNPHLSPPGMPRHREVQTRKARASAAEGDHEQGWAHQTRCGKGPGTPCPKSGGWGDANLTCLDQGVRSKGEDVTGDNTERTNAYPLYLYASCVSPYRAVYTRPQ